MSPTTTRPPLFDPEPTRGFDSDTADERPRYPFGGSSGGRRASRPRDSSTSPRWVRPFIFGGLVLIALVSAASILMTGSDAPPSDVPAPSSAVLPSADDTTMSGDDGAAATAEPTVPAVDADPDPDLATAGDVTTDRGGSASDALTDGVQVAPTAVAGAIAPDLQVPTAFAVQFAHDYLNYDEATPGVRERNLRAYLAPGLDPQLGWDGQGVQLAVLTLPVEAIERDGAVMVTVAAEVTGQDAPRWVHLAVPLAQDARGRWAVISAPSFVPRPGPGNVDPVDGPEAVDQALSSTLTPTMTRLFEAFASDSAVEIAGITSPGAVIRGLGGQVEFGSVDRVRIAADGGDTREATVRVTWLDPVTDAGMSQTYLVAVSESEDGWLVDAVGAR